MSKELLAGAGYLALFVVVGPFFGFCAAWSKEALKQELSISVYLLLLAIGFIFIAILFMLITWDARCAPEAIQPALQAGVAWGLGVGIMMLVIQYCGLHMSLASATYNSAGVAFSFLICLWLLKESDSVRLDLAVPGVLVIMVGVCLVAAAKK